MKRKNYILIIILIFMGCGCIELLGNSKFNTDKIIDKDECGRNIYQVSANGIDIGYKIIGAGEPLLLVMGLGGTMEEWPSEIIKRLSKHYQNTIS